jgi:hypothetical protein
MSTPFTHEDAGNDERPANETRLHVEEEHELERRTRAAFRAAERGGMQWRRRSPNQRFVAHRRGNR